MSSLSRLPANLPLTSDAKIPQTYAVAKAALERCSRVDECKTWADKAEALSSYARQADDRALRQLADRIQARAIRRCGELLREIAPNPGGRPTHKTHTGSDTSLTRTQASDAQSARTGSDTSTRTQAATDAGLSKRQKDTALRVANVPQAEFEAAVESAEPPTVTQLAERGKKSKPVPLIDLKGRDPKEFALSTYAQGELERCAEMTERIAPDIAVRGAFDHERTRMLANAGKICNWIEQIVKEVPNVSRDD